MQVLVDNLRVATLHILDLVDWMDAGTRKEAMLKLSEMREKIGYPHYIYNETKILKDYKGVSCLAILP